MKKRVLIALFLATVLLLSAVSSSAAVMENYYNGSKKPVFRVACFADLHVDYGIQSYGNPIRPSTITAVNYVQNTLGGADVILVGGDIVSNNGRLEWTNQLWNRSVTTVYSTLARGSKSGKVMMVSGNHETEVGVAAGDTVYTGDYSDWMTASSLGNFKAALYFNDMGLGNSKYNELLCYRYNVNGMEFIGMNTPYRPQRSSGYIYPEQIDWVGEQLAEIGADKTVIVFSHFPTGGVVSPAGSDRDSGSEMKALFAKYPNVIYCYGHVHGGDEFQVRENSVELVFSQGRATRLENNAYETKNWIYCHMGSLGYYDYTYQPGGLGAEDPYVVQIMVIDFYSDHITFQMHNTGEREPAGGTYYPSSYTVMRDMTAQLNIADDSANTGRPGAASAAAGAVNLPLILGIGAGVVVVVAAGVFFVLRRRQEY